MHLLYDATSKIYLIILMKVTEEMHREDTKWTSHVVIKQN